MRVTEYLKLSREERVRHVDLNTACELGGPRSRRGKLVRKALLERLGLEDDVVNWTQGQVHLCHVCEHGSTNGYCANTSHVYVGKPSENQRDRPLEDLQTVGRLTLELKVGLHDPKNQERVREGGRRGGLRSAELGVGFHAPATRSRAGKAGGKKLHEERDEFGRSLEALRRHSEKNEEGKSKLAVKAGESFKQRWVSLCDGWVGNASSVSKHNKSLGWSGEEKVKLSAEEFEKLKPHLLTVWSRPKRAVKVVPPELLTELRKNK